MRVLLMDVLLSTGHNLRVVACAIQRRLLTP